MTSEIHKSVRLHSMPQERREQGKGCVGARGGSETCTLECQRPGQPRLECQAQGHPHKPRETHFKIKMKKAGDAAQWSSTPGPMPGTGGGWGEVELSRAPPAQQGGCQAPRQELLPVGPAQRWGQGGGRVTVKV